MCTTYPFMTMVLNQFSNISLIILRWKSRDYSIMSRFVSLWVKKRNCQPMIFYRCSWLWGIKPWKTDRERFGLDLQSCCIVNLNTVWCNWTRRLLRFFGWHVTLTIYCWWIFYYLILSLHVYLLIIDFFLSLLWQV